MAPTPPDDPRSDQELVDACNAGDAEAFGAIYRRYRGWAIGVAYRFTGERESALDVAQEAFVYLLSRFPGFRLSGGGLAALLYVALRNGAYTRARRRRSAARWDGGGAGTPVRGEGLLDEASGRLREAVEALPEGQREVLLMRVVDGMSVREIARALSVPEGTVKSRLHHALAALRSDPRARGYFEDL
jgi:RNA polymerase sigma-70 factor (ECF subfamily)